MIETARNLTLEIQYYLDILKKRGTDSSFFESEIQKIENYFLKNTNSSQLEILEISKKLAKFKDILNCINKLKLFLEDLNLIIDDFQITNALNSFFKETIEEINIKFSEIKISLDIFLQKKIENDDCKAYIEIFPGIGGTESSIFALEIFDAYTNYFKLQKLTYNVISLDYDSNGGIKSAVILLADEGVYSKLRFESGIFRVQRIPRTESSGRIHTSTIIFTVVPIVKTTTEININPKDIRVDVFRSNGPGGQSVNTTDSAVRITHIPSGIVVTCQSERSQIQNKAQALEVLKNKLVEINNKDSKDTENKIRKDSSKDAERSQKVRTFNFPQSRITDHRISFTWYSIENFFKGEFDDIVSHTNLTIRKSLERDNA